MKIIKTTQAQTPFLNNMFHYANLISTQFFSVVFLKNYSENGQISFHFGFYSIPPAMCREMYLSLLYFLDWIVLGRIQAMNVSNKLKILSNLIINHVKSHRP